MLAVAQAVPWETALMTTAVCGALLVLGERVDSQLARWAFKPVASLGFIAAALAAHTSVFGAYHDLWDVFEADDPASAIVIGLLLSWWGDVLLIPSSEIVFKSGILAFLLGHLAYSVAFLRMGVDARGCGFAVLPVIPFAYIVLCWLMPDVPSDMVAPVIAYILVICSMVVLSVGAYAAGADELFPIGAIAFLFSDLFVARERFVAPGFVNRAIGLPLYYGSQLILAAAIYRLV